MTSSAFALKAIRVDATKPEDDRGPVYALVKAALDGSEAAFIELVRKYQDRILGLLVHLTGNRDDAEDVAQETFARAFSRLGSFTFKSAFYTWLYRIAVNAASDHRKRRKRRIAVSLQDLVQDPPALGVADDRPDRSAMKAELRSRLHQLIAELPPIFRTVLVMRELEGLSYEEIASVLGCSIGTVESRLFRARARIRESIGPYYSAGDVLAS